MHVPLSGHCLFSTTDFLLNGIGLYPNRDTGEAKLRMLEGATGGLNSHGTKKVETYEIFMDFMKKCFNIQ